MELYHYNKNHDPVTGRFTNSTVFVSGSSKTTIKGSPYYRRRLPRAIRDELSRHMDAQNNIIVGDAPGVDRQVQDYLKKKRYDRVTVYGPGSSVRYMADEKWRKITVDDKRTKPGSKAWLAAKDKKMSKVADEGLAIVLDEGSRATRENVRRLIEANKKVKVYELSKNNKRGRQLIKPIGPFDAWAINGDLVKYTQDDIDRIIDNERVPRPFWW